MPAVVPGDHQRRLARRPTSPPSGTSCRNSAVNDHRLEHRHRHRAAGQHAGLPRGDVRPAQLVGGHGRRGGDVRAVPQVLGQRPVDRRDAPRRRSSPASAMRRAGSVRSGPCDGRPQVRHLAADAHRRRCRTSTDRSHDGDRSGWSLRTWQPRDSARSLGGGQQRRRRPARGSRSPPTSGRRPRAGTAPSRRRHVDCAASSPTRSRPMPADRLIVACNSRPAGRVGAGYRGQDQFRRPGPAPAAPRRRPPPRPAPPSPGPPAASSTPAGSRRAARCGRPRRPRTVPATVVRPSRSVSTPPQW